jgi:hypothetical protein
MVANKVKSVKSKPKSVKKLIKPKSSKKSVNSTKKSNDIVSKSLLGATGIGAIGTLGSLGYFGGKYLLEKRLIPYLEKNYDHYPLVHPKKYIQYKQDYEDLSPIFKNLTFNFYIDESLFRLRDNYNLDKEMIRKYNKKCGDNKTCEITRLYDYLLNHEKFKSYRPVLKKFNSIENVAN